MKVLFDKIYAQLIKEADALSCSGCCFQSNRNCVPMEVHRCIDCIFIETTGEVFEL